MNVNWNYKKEEGEFLGVQSSSGKVYILKCHSLIVLLALKKQNHRSEESLPSTFFFLFFALRALLGGVT